MNESTPFHTEEIAIQSRLGIAEQVARSSQGFIRSYMPEQHRTFFSQLSFVITSMLDANGYPWIVPTFSHQGFIETPDERTLQINALPMFCETLELDFSVQSKIGLLGIQFDTRRRNRLNGKISSITTEGFSVHVEQSFGNCPQYIQQRVLASDMDVSDFSAPELTFDSQLSAEVIALIESSDTFFIASRTHHITDDVRTGLDASHRGGKPGFVKVAGNKLYFPDFSGNRFFNTLGNIVSDGRVGLWFPHFQSGQGVMIKGMAQVIWDPEQISQVEGAERLMEVVVESVSSMAQMMPVKGELLALSPSLKRTGVWGSAE